MIENLNEAIFRAGDDQASVGAKGTTQRLPLKALQRARDLQRSRIVNLDARRVGYSKVIR